MQRWDEFPAGMRPYGKGRYVLYSDVRQALEDAAKLAENTDPMWSGDYLAQQIRSLIPEE